MPAIAFEMGAAFNGQRGMKYVADDVSGRREGDLPRADPSFDAPTNDNAFTDDFAFYGRLFADDERRRLYVPFERPIQLDFAAGIDVATKDNVS